MEINLGKIVLRPWTDGDAVQLADIANSKEVYDNLRDAFPHPYSLKDAKEWISFIKRNNYPPRFFAIEYESWLAGSIGITLKEDIYRRNAEIGYFIGEQFKGKGIASDAVKAAVRYAFETFDIVRIYAEPL
ncbi:MAG: GNAT family N-acetyltransferase, partial [Bacteroidetes bacterium]|nr:GNAT family N-acetyltransferase [Bacteroidota bacterium]